MFDTLTTDQAVKLAGDDAPSDLAREMHRAWVSFITNGDPGWPAFGTERMTRIWDAAPRVVPQRRAAVVDALR